MKRIRTLVSELVAVVTRHPIVAVEVADAFVTVTLPVVVSAPEITVELAEVFLIVSPERRVSWVVLAPPRNVARPVTLRVLESVVAPATVSAPDPVVLISPAVVIDVLMVVAACAIPALKKTTASPSNTVRVVLPMVPRYVLIQVMNNNYV